MGKRGAFLRACKTGNIDRISNLLTTRISVNTCDFENTTVLMHACNSGELDAVKILLDNGANVNMQNERGITALHIACDIGNLDMVRMLVEYGADATIPDRDTGNCALHWAVVKDDEHIVETLLDTGIDINIRSSVGATSLHFACLVGSKKMVSLLLARGAKVDAICNRQAVGLTPLHLACMYVRIGNNDRKLIEREVMNLDSTAVIHPVFWEDITERREIVRILLEHGADIGIKTMSNFCAMDLANDKETVDMLKKQAKIVTESLSDYFLRACSIGNIKIVNECICRGIDVNVKNENGSTPLICASINGHRNVVEALIKSGGEINIKNIYGETALFYASVGEYRDVVELLLENGASVESKEIENYSLLTCMCASDSKEIVDLFIENGADINLTTSGITDLMYACMRNDVNVVEALLKYGADPNIEDDCGQTALHMACSNGNRKNVELLLKYGANKDAKDIFDRTPIEIAYQKGRYNVTCELIKNGCKIQKQVMEWILCSQNVELIKILARRNDMYKYVVRRLIVDKQKDILHDVKNEWRIRKGKYYDKSSDLNLENSMSSINIEKISCVNKIQSGRIL